MSVLMQEVNRHLTSQISVSPNPGPIQFEKVPDPKILTKSDFPKELVEAVGEENLANMPQVTVQEKSTGYFDGCFSLDMIPESGAIKGTDQYGRVFITFAVVNPKYREINEAAEQNGSNRSEAEEVVLFTVLQRKIHKGNINEALFMTRLCPSIPTDDERFFAGIMSKDQYEAIKEVFAGRHKDLMLGTSKELAFLNKLKIQENSFLNKLKTRENSLRDFGLSDEDVSKYVGKYKEELRVEDEQKQPSQTRFSLLERV